MVGEIGGDEEEKAAAFIEAEMSKPVVAYIAGFTRRSGKTMGHAGAIISGSAGTAQAKKDALEARGIRVGTTPTEAAQIVAEIVRGRLSRRVQLRNRERDATPFTTKDGSTIREYLHTDAQSLPRRRWTPVNDAAALPRAERGDLPHRRGRGSWRSMATASRRPGRRDPHPAGQWHQLAAADSGTTLLCCCVPPYSDDDTFFA